MEESEALLATGKDSDLGVEGEYGVWTELCSLDLDFSEEGQTLKRKTMTPTPITDRIPLRSIRSSALGLPKFFGATAREL